MLRTVISSCFLGVSLAACGVVTPQGIVTGARLDPLATPPFDIAVAVGVPDSVKLRDGDAAFYLGFAPDNGPVTETTVPLSLLDDKAPRAATAGEAIYVFGFSPKAAAEVAETQASITDLQAQGVEGTGTLSVTLEGGCLTGPLTDSLPFKTWLRAAPDADFVPLTREADLFEVFPEADLRARLTPC